MYILNFTKQASILIHSANPQSRPVAIIVSGHVSTFQNIAKQNKLQMKIIIATGGTVGPAEGIIDDTCLVILFILLLNIEIKNVLQVMLPPSRLRPGRYHCHRFRILKNRFPTTPLISGQTQLEFAIRPVYEYLKRRTRTFVCNSEVKIQIKKWQMPRVILSFQMVRSEVFC